MATFVLIHGAWHGGWCWARVTDRLRAQGHTVFAPSLSGLAEHGNRIDAAIGHDVHIEDTTRVIEWNDLDNVVLVGHSYGGLVVTGAAAGMVRKANVNVARQESADRQHDRARAKAQA